MKNRQKLISIFAGVGLYLISTGTSFAAFTFFSKTGVSGVVSPPAVSPGDGREFKVDPSLPKNSQCPLNGAYYTEKEKEDWEKRRPLAVMVENSPDSRPQSGLSRADVVYEALAEGVATRFMALFYCNTPFENITIAPVRSARTYFIDWLSEYDALYSHVGGANRIGVNRERTDSRADAIGQIDAYGIKDLDQFGIGYPDCFRNPDRTGKPVATEHTMVCLSQNLYEIAKERGWTNVDSRGIAWDKNFYIWPFKDDAKEKDRGNTSSISLDFSSPEYFVEWKYDKETNTYNRFNSGEPHKDHENGQQLRAKTVIAIVSTLEGPIDENLHYLYQTIGNDSVYVFLDGDVVEGTWKKLSRIGRTKLYDLKGKEIKLNRGPIYIEVLSSTSEITYK